MTIRPALICGVDEAGRGPLAGAVYAAAVILDPAHPIDGLADSKTLSPKKRDFLASQIKERALSWAIASSSVAEIDRINILQASLLAMKRAVESLHLLPERILVDGLHCPRVSMAAEAIVKGDSQVEAIAAASILAKTARDAEMCRLHEIYPQYEFASHKGYSTSIHLERLLAHGACPEHRRSFAPVRELLSGGEQQEDGRLALQLG
jgi:ribonuclease HII